MLLNMSRLQFVALRQTSLALVLNVGLAILLVPALGIEGAAVATAVAMCAWNALLWRQVRRHLGIRPTIFARMRAGEVNAGPLRPAAA
jgi:O-antigen/teichoic acid export membrane protein